MGAMRTTLTDEQRALKSGVADICKRYPGEYWRELDRERAYPEAFVTELTRAGLPGGAHPAGVRRAPGSASSRAA